MLTPNVRGVLWMLAAVIALTAMFAVAKHLTRDLPVLEVSLFRMLAALLFYLPWLMHHGIGIMRTERIKTHLMRGFFGATSLFCMVYAVANLILADATVLGFTIPLWSIVLAALFLGERVRLRRSIATIVGFIGVILVAKPQAGVAPAALVALGGAILASAAITTMKELTRTEPADRIVVYFLLTGTLILAGPAIYVWQTPTAEQWGWVVLLGLFGSSGQTFLTRAYANGEMTIIAPLDFLRVIVAGIIGYFIFDELPDAWAFAGTAVVVAACAYIVRREAMLRRDAATPPSGPGASV